MREFVRWGAVVVIGFIVMIGFGFTSGAKASAPSTKIVINIGQHKLYLYRHDKLFQVYPVAVGKASTPSPRGEYQVTQKSVWGDGFGTRWMRISVPWGIYGIHGTNKPWSVGTVASHGCFRMLNRDVEQVYALVSVGTPVDVVGATPMVSIRRPLKSRNIGQDVVELERLLRLAHVYRGPLGGVFTAEVEASVKRFQTVVGISPSGVATSQTVKKLLDYTHQAQQKPKYLARA